MSSESVCQVARSWVQVGSFHTRLLIVARFMIFTASVWNILDTPSCIFIRIAVYKTAILLPSFIFVLLFSANRVLPLGWQNARKLLEHKRLTKYME
jgi:hypothetical protein